METQTQEVAFSSKLRTAMTLVGRVKTLLVTNAQEFQAAGQNVNAIREIEKDLEAEYKAHPIIIDAKKLQGIKSELATMLEEARRSTKAKMMKYEDDEEAKRKAEEDRQTKIAKDKADAEAKRIKDEADKKAADDLAAAQAAEAAGDHETAATHLANAEQAEQEGRTAAQEAASAPAPAVVLPKTTPKVAGHTRRMIKKWRIRTKTGALYTSEDFQKKTLRIPAEEFAGLRSQFFMLNHTAVTALVDGMGKAAAIPNVLEVWEEPA